MRNWIQHRPLERRFKDLSNNTEFHYPVHLVCWYLESICFPSKREVKWYCIGVSLLSLPSQSVAHTTSLLAKYTTMLVDLPPGCKPVGQMWTFKRNMRTYSSINKYKSTRVVKGYQQMEDIDYFDILTRADSIGLVYKKFLSGWS